MVKDILKLAALGALLATAACGQDNRPEAPAAASATTAAPAADVDSSAKTGPASGIAWFEGSVDEAFAHAGATGKPIYLYWGAVWCPPCHAINATVFSRPEFIERSRLFVPVYLDGDTADAQALGERFGVLGYPTMIVFDSDGTELTRIPGGIDIQAYANVLDLTLGETAGAGVLVERLMSDAAAGLEPRECRLLAYYSWGQDTRILDATGATAGAFRRMYEACPADLGVERSILYLTWLESVIAAGDGDPELSATQRAEALARLHDVLDNYDQAKANLLTLLFSGADFAAALTTAGSAERAALAARFDTLYERIAADESVYKRERIYTLVGKMGFERIDDEEAPVSPALREEIETMVVWADTTTQSVYERQPIVNALGNVLEEAGMDEVAKPLLLAELDRSQQPYYFMVTLADIEERAGNDAAAIDWLRQAWEAASGPATRFQWGYYYLSGLLDLAPERTELIHATTLELIDELQRGGGFYQRPKRQLALIEKKLAAWSESHADAEALARIRENVLALCRSDDRPASREACERFLETA